MKTVGPGAMKTGGGPTPKEMADDTFGSLIGKPYLIRMVFEALFYPAPWMGWAPMLCEIARKVQDDRRQT